MKRAVSAVALMLAVSAHAHAGEIARADLTITGSSLEVERKEVDTAVDAPAFVQTIFGGKTNGDVPPSDLVAAGELSGPGIDPPIHLVTQPGHRFAIPALHQKGEYTLDDIRLIDAGGALVQRATPSFVTIVVTDVLQTSVRVRQLTADELRQRGITLDASLFDAYHWIEITDSNGVSKGTWRIAAVTANSKTVTLAPNGAEAIALVPGDRWQGVYRFDTLHAPNGGTVGGSDPIRLGASGPSGPVVLDGPAVAGVILTMPYAIAGSSVTLDGNVNIGDVTAVSSLTIGAGTVTVGNAGATSVEIANGATFGAVTVSAATVHIANGAVVRNAAAGETPITLNASATLTVDSGGAVEVSGRGYPATKTIAGGTAPGGSSGGSHLGIGGVVNTPPGSTFGSVEGPLEAGGGGGSSTGGPGGGAITISTPALVVDGALRANGIGTTNGAGGGAGGSVWIVAGAIGGSGTIEARSGNVTASAGSGGGGAIAIDYASASGSLLANVSARPGTSNNASRIGGGGTLWMHSSASTFGDLIVDNSGVTPAQTTNLPSLGNGTAQSGTSGATLVTDRASNVPPYFVGHWVEVTDSVGTLKGRWRIASVTANSKTVTLAASAGEAIALVAGDKWRGIYRFDLLRLRSAKLQSGDRVDYTASDIDGSSQILAVEPTHE